MDEKIKRYLDKVVELLVRDTEIDYERDEIFTPFSFWSLSTQLFFFDKYLLVAHWSLFSQYCYDIYGLSGDEISYVRSEYRNIIIDKINNNGSINESEDKQKKFLDKVLEIIIRDTEIDYETKTWYSPFIHHNTNYFKVSNPSMYFLYHMFNIFSDYCIDVYGLREDEIIYLWKKYTSFMGDKFKPYTTINESEDRHKRYLDKVLNLMIKDTYIINKIQLHVPFSVTPVGLRYSSRDTVDILSYIAYSMPPIIFSVYCINIYGLTEYETFSLWVKYKEFIIKEYLTNS